MTLLYGWLYSWIVVWQYGDEVAIYSRQYVPDEPTILFHQSFGNLFDEFSLSAAKSATNHTIMNRLLSWLMPGNVTQWFRNTIPRQLGYDWWATSQVRECLGPQGSDIATPLYDSSSWLTWIWHRYPSVWSFILTHMDLTSLPLCMILHLDPHGRTSLPLCMILHLDPHGSDIATPLYDPSSWPTWIWHRYPSVWSFILTHMVGHRYPSVWSFILTHMVGHSYPLISIILHTRNACQWGKIVKGWVSDSVIRVHAAYEICGYKSISKLRYCTYKMYYVIYMM
jgi:hypothetical protein